MRRRAHRGAARDRRQGRLHGRPRARRDAARSRARARRRPPGRRRATSPQAIDGGREGVEGLVALAVGGARVASSCAPPSCSPGPWRDTLERRDDARPVEDRAPGGDRRRLRARRLPPLQRRVHDPDLRRAAGLRPGRLEPDRVPAARGLRLRRLAVQLHRDRRQPDELGRADGERRRLEAGVDRDALARTT